MGKPTLDCVALFHRLQSRTEPKGKQKLNMNIQVSLPFYSGQWTKSLRLPLPYCPLDSRCHVVPRGRTDPPTGHQNEPFISFVAFVRISYHSSEKGFVIQAP